VRRLAALALVLSTLLADAAPVNADRWYAPAPLLGIVDASRQMVDAQQAGATWDRALFLWQEIQPNGASDWTLDRYVDQNGLRPTLEARMPVVGVVQGTPIWAAVNWRDQAAAVPSGLEFAFDDPRNTFGQYMLRLARAYKGRITTWVIWNEPDFLPGESGTWWTWAGSAEDFARLLRTGYRAIKQVDPSATVVFPATTYFADAVHGRELFLQRVLREVNNDPDAPKYGYYFDAAAVNLYCSLDAVYRVYGVYAAILTSFNLSKPIWLTETNCPVYNDGTTPMAATGRISTDEQAAYLLESVALARAAGYQRIGWYSMVDHAPTSGILDRWGLLRADGSRRPAFRAFQVARQYLADPDSTARLAPLGTASADGWPVTRVIIDSASAQSRVQVLWRTPGGPPAVRVEAAGASAVLVDPLGVRTNVERVGGAWDVPLPPARVPMPSDPPGFQSVGYPVLLVESGVPVQQLVVQTPLVTSPVMALLPSAPEPPATLATVPRPSITAGSAAPPVTVPAVVQPGPSLVLSVANPQPGDLLPRGKYVMQGLAFDRAAPSGTGVDRVSVFLEDRDSGGQHIGDASLGQANGTGFTVTADLSRAAGGHTLYVYARSNVTGREAVVSFPVTIGQ
jgi:hypothetical protein